MPFRSKVSLIFLMGFALDLLNLFVLNSAYPALQRQLGDRAQREAAARKSDAE